MYSLRLITFAALELLYSTTNHRSIQPQRTHRPSSPNTNPPNYIPWTKSNFLQSSVPNENIRRSLSFYELIKAVFAATISANCAALNLFVRFIV